MFVCNYKMYMCGEQEITAIAYAAAQTCHGAISYFVESRSQCCNYDSRRILEMRCRFNCDILPMNSDGTKINI